MVSKNFAMSTNILMGEGVCQQIQIQAEIRNATKIMLVTDEGLINAGVVDKVLAHIDSSKFEICIYDEVKPDPSVNVVNKGAELVWKNGIDLIIAVGGGSSIDAGKGISVVATNGGSAADYEGLNKYTNPPIPLFAIPTTCGTGSEVTFGAVLTNTETDYKFILYGYNCAPQVAFLDPALLLGITEKILVPPAMDALTHAVESYISKGATLQSKAMALEAISLISENFKIAVADTANLDAMSNMLYAANIAGIAFGCSRLGIVHAMALPLGACFHVPHGIANSILLPHGLDYNLGSDDQGYCDMAKAMGADLTGLSERQGAEKFIGLVRSLAYDVGAPTKLSEVSVASEQIPNMAEDTMKSSHIPFNPRKVYTEQVKEIYLKAM